MTTREIRIIFDDQSQFKVCFKCNLMLYIYKLVIELSKFKKLSEQILLTITVVMAITI